MKELEAARLAGDAAMEADLLVDEAIILLRLGRFEKATELLDRILKEHGESKRVPEVMYWLGACRLNLSGNDITDLEPLSGIGGLENLDLGYNQITDLGPLTGLYQLHWLYLGSNQITDLGPLVENSGLSDGDFVFVWDNPVDCDEQADNLSALRSLGVNVISDCE